MTSNCIHSSEMIRSHLASLIPIKKQDETEIESPKMTPSMILIGAITFVGDSSRGVFFPVLQALCLALKGSEIDLGYLVAMFSFGRLLVTTPLGILSDRYGQKMPLILATTTLTIGALLWANSYSTHSIATLYISQFVLGCGSGSLGVTRSYVAERSHPKIRTQTLALMTALQYAGFTVSPLFGSMLAYFGTLIDSYWIYALPGYSIALVALYCVIALLVVFDDTPEDPTAKQITSTTITTTTSPILESSPEFAGKQVELANLNEQSQHSQQHINGSNLNESFAGKSLDLIELGDTRDSQQQADTIVGNNTVENTNTGASEVFNPLHSHSAGYKSVPSTEPSTDSINDPTSIMNPVTANTNESNSIINPEEKDANINSSKSKEKKKLMSFCIIAMILLNVTTKGSISVYETIGAHIAITRYGMTVTEVGILVTSCGVFGFVQLLLFKSFWTKYFSDMTLMLGGIFTMIISQMIAVSYAQEPTKEAFLTSFIIMYAVGYPIGHTAVLGAFSKIQKKGTQGALMGYFATAGSAARIVIPIITGYLDQAVNNAPFCIVMFLLTISYGCLILLRPALQGLIEDKSDPLFDGNLWRTWRCLTRREKAEIAFMVLLFAFSMIALFALSTGQGFGWNDKDSVWDLDER